MQVLLMDYISLCLQGREVYQKWLENKSILKSVIWLQF